MQSRSHRGCAILFAAAGALAVPTGTAAAQDKARSRRHGRRWCFILGVVRGRLSRQDVCRALPGMTRVTAAVFTILIEALLFGYFLTITQTPQTVTALLTGLGIGRGRTRPDPSAGWHEHFRYQKRHRRCKNFHDLLRRAAVYRH
jgi:hypothetical protein